MLALVAEQRSAPKAPKAPDSNRHLVAPAPATGGRERFASISGVPTELLTLTPAFMDALRKVAPKKRRAKIPYVIALGLVAVLVMLGADPSTREFGLSKLAAFRSTPAAAPAPAPEPAPIATAVTTLTSADAPTVSTPAVATPSAPVADEPAPAPAAEASPAKRSPAKTSPAAQPKKPQPRSATRPASQRRTAMVK
jgi:hypothetical protein